MFEKWSWSVVLCLTTMVIFDEVSSELPRNSPFLHVMSKHYSGARTPRTVRWAYQQQGDSYRHASQGTSHGYVSHPHESALKSTETPLKSFQQLPLRRIMLNNLWERGYWLSGGGSKGQQDGSLEYPSYSISSQEYWRPSTVDSNLTGVSYHGYSRTHVGLTSATSWPPYQDSKQGSYSKYHFQQTLPGTSGQVAFKKIPTHHMKGNFQVQGFDVYGKSKYKKTNLRQSPTVHKKLVYPRVHKPYVKHKYPTRKTVHPLYRRYYQSPYQRYEIPSREMLRYGVNPQTQDYQAVSTASPSTYPAASDRYHYTTERMDDAYPDGSSSSEDYSAYNDTHRKSNANYYETYEEVEKTTLEPEESSYEESTTRGYYGDRIYMSTQVPHLGSDKANVKNKYFLIRRTSDDDDDDDIETIFE